MQNVHFTPPELARMFGVNESTVKRWIDRGILPAERTAGGHRRVSKRDMDTFLRSRNKGVAHSYHLRRVREFGRSYDASFYYRLHLAGDTRGAREYLVSAYVGSGDVVGVLEGVVVPALRMIGTEWLKGAIDIADEHRMSFYIRSDLLVLRELMGDVSMEVPGAMLACVPGENHELALVLLSLVFAGSGYRPIVLGINVPERELISGAKRFEAHILALSKVYKSRREHTPLVRDLAFALPHTTIFLGGSGWSLTERAACGVLKGVCMPETLRELADMLATSRRSK